MSLAQLFYMKETFRESVRRWRQVCFRKRSHARREQRFILEALEPRVLLSGTPAIQDGLTLNDPQLAASATSEMSLTLLPLPHVVRRRLLLEA